jgi:hypothetical protein
LARGEVNHLIAGSRSGAISVGERLATCLSRPATIGSTTEIQTAA